MIIIDLNPKKSIIDLNPKKRSISFVIVRLLFYENMKIFLT